MPSNRAHYLTLVWPPQGSDEDPGDSSSILEQGLKSDGWRSVSLPEMRALPPGRLFVLHMAVLWGKPTFWLKMFAPGQAEPIPPQIEDFGLSMP